jgi:acyl carrier protein
MTTYNPETLEAVRGAVARVRETDMSSVQPADNLNLDSVDRIGLIAELENVFAIELPSEAIVPEAFESLSSLAELISTRR